MKTISRLISLAALAAAFALPALAQDTAAAQNICDEQARTDLYTDYYNSKAKKDASGNPDAAAQKHAYEVGQQYLQKYATACPDKYTESVRKFVDAYGKAMGDYELMKAYNEKRWADVVSIGKQALANNPNDVKTSAIVAWAAYNGTIKPTNNAALAPDALSQAQHTLQLIESGQSASSYAPFTSKEEAQAYMQYILGALNLKDNPTESAKYLVQLAQGNSTLKQDPSVYLYLAADYEREYAKLAEDYKKFTTETDESRIALANINQVIDRIIDAYARAVAYGKNDPNKAQWMAKLTELYKSRHNNSDAGLNEMLASVTTKPLLITTPVTTPPPADTTGTGDGTTGAKPPTAAPMTTTPPATTTPTKPAQPATKKPPMRNHHG